MKGRKKWRKMPSIPPIFAEKFEKIKKSLGFATDYALLVTLINLEYIELFE